MTRFIENISTIFVQNSKAAEAYFYSYQEANGVDEQTFWRYHLKASVTKKFIYEVEVFEKPSD